MNTVTIGMDLGNTKNYVCVLDSNGNVVERTEIRNKAEALKEYYEKYQGATVIIETGTHSPWVSRTLENIGCRVMIGNARKLRMIWKNAKKSDEKDAEMLARIGRFDPSLLHPIHHRSEKAQADLAIIKARDMLVQSRSSLINHVRGAVKSIGFSLPSCSSTSFSKKVNFHIPEILQNALDRIVEEIERLTEIIKAYDKDIGMISEKKYPETKVLRQVPGVGPITSLAYILTLEEAKRFKQSRQVGAYLGLTPKRDQSGESDKQLRISKAGSKYMRRLLVGCTHYILGPFGPDSELRRHGERIAGRGGKNAKRRAIVAVARKLSVLLHRLWDAGEVYDPFYHQNRRNIQHQAA